MISLRGDDQHLQSPAAPEHSPFGIEGNDNYVRIDLHVYGSMIQAEQLPVLDFVQKATDRGAHGTVLVYRDRIVPKSEAHFLRRLYIGFERLDPVWIGCRTDGGLPDLGADPIILGRAGPLGAVDRALFKQFGAVPRRPDLAALSPRVLHAHFGRGGALALPLARALRIPLVVTFHGGDATKEKHYRRGWVPTIFQRRLAQLKQEAALIVCVSEYIRDRLVQRGFPRRKLRVIHYGVEPHDAAAPESAPASAQPYVLFVGRFVEKKGVVTLIEAMRKLEARNLDVRLVLIGDGPMASEVKQRAGALGDAQFLGWLPNRAVRSWMQGAIAVCVPSVAAGSGDSEGLPNVVIEAMAAGAPVVASRHGGIVEAVEHGRTGLLVPPGDSHALAEALHLLAQDPQTRKRMGEAARQRWGERFNATTQSRLLEDALLSVVS
jgi:colanic acid/amylovoran biosynthesis glycosyltransferase